ncbi:hypothetical protein BDV38DRAFT_285515 [Aspergillus pseudotamarii]|uniref:Uncharacterized protein n=1 Tax=Aspergillus pseudotamarii TaxID=132259 RepID=A0A5N6SLG0_ASPPS|nr:uncharacterized protein BDV38DRAFT_285515 [Aspergillus pseudotamarii]KAE8134737.1 hypothetical protein BDV38DRAFT_285515 [Aspergillus pseudotamarii]
MESSRLEALPAEMKYAILCALPDLASFNALVHASTTFHMVYLSRRKELLSNVLKRYLQLPVLIEAVAALIALRDLEERRKKPKGCITAIEDFLYKYIPLRSNLNPNLRFMSKYHKQGLNVYDVFATFTENDLIEMARLHTMVEYISEDMVCYFLKAIPGTQEQERSITISPSESYRIQRAIYRLEIFRHLCEQTYVDGEEPSYIPPSGGEIRSYLLSVLSPWEMEETKCFQEYIFHHYEVLPGASYSADNWELFPEEDDPANHIYEHDIHDSFRETFMLFGVGYLYRWIRVSRISCPEERLAQQIAMTRGQLGYADCPFHDAFEEDPEFDCYIDYGDGGISGRIILSDEDWNMPNLAWKWRLEPGTRDDYRYAFAASWNHTIRTWGYVFWDRHRFEEWDIDLQTLKEQFKGIWNSPRNWAAWEGQLPGQTTDHPEVSENMELNFISDHISYNEIAALLEKCARRKVEKSIMPMEVMDHVWKHKEDIPEDLKGKRAVPDDFWILVKGMQGSGRLWGPPGQIHNDLFRNVKMMTFERYFENICGSQ